MSSEMKNLYGKRVLFYRFLIGSTAESGTVSEISPSGVNIAIVPDEAGSSKVWVKRENIIEEL